ncbi:MAG: tRNA (adenosine(37)-N6)-threonylcarbamoyltransferase complex dimerization subunit type 1 TsaB [Candidatus Omnitrophota bacterium]
MKWIAMDTSTEYLSLGISEGEEVLYAQTVFLERKHSTELLPFLEKALEQVNFSIEETGGFIVGLGPGSFTGLRVGVSMVKAMASSLGKPLVGIPTLDCLAFAVPENAASIAVLVDAKRNQIYAARYEKKNTHLRKITKERVMLPESFLKSLKGETLFLGDGAVLYRDLIQKRMGPKARFAEPAYNIPNPEALIALGRAHFEEGKLENPKTLVPLYLYPKDCMIKKG